MLKEVKVFSQDYIVLICTENEFFTRGNVCEYSQLFDYIEEYNNGRSHSHTEYLKALHYVADSILNHSDTDFNLESIVWLIDKYCTYTNFYFEN